MRKKFSVMVLSVFILTILPAVSISAKPPLVGVMDLQFNLGWPGPQADIPDWVGTIIIDGQEYGMAFFCTGSGKAFDDDFKGKIHFFEEIWAIYDGIQFEFDGNGVLTTFEPGSILLWGYDYGQTNIQTSDYHMNGNVEEANGDFAMWEGRSVHMKGIIEWYLFGAPYKAPGIFRIN